ncbi:MAG: hypothetical protein V3V74_07335 [Nitrosomonadaceae bacterium]
MRHKSLHTYTNAYTKLFEGKPDYVLVKSFYDKGVAVKEAIEQTEAKNLIDNEMNSGELLEYCYRNGVTHNPSKPDEHLKSVIYQHLIDLDMFDEFCANFEDFMAFCKANHGKGNIGETERRAAIQSKEVKSLDDIFEQDKPENGGHGLLEGPTRDTLVNNLKELPEMLKGHDFILSDNNTIVKNDKWSIFVDDNAPSEEFHPYVIHDQNLDHHEWVETLTDVVNMIEAHTPAPLTNKKTYAFGELSQDIQDKLINEYSKTNDANFIITDESDPDYVDPKYQMGTMIECRELDYYEDGTVVEDTPAPSEVLFCPDCMETVLNDSGFCHVCEKTYKNPTPSETDNWHNNHIQYPRLIAEIYAAGICDETKNAVLDSMNITSGELHELFVRAEREWEVLKAVKS